MGVVSQRRVVPRLAPSPVRPSSSVPASRRTSRRRRPSVLLVPSLPHFFVTVPSSRPPGIYSDF